MEEFLRSWGYLGVFLGIIATGAGFPMPEELPVVVGGAIAGGGQALWYVMLPVCIVGVILGDCVLYLIGRIWGPSIVERPFIKKHILPPERLTKIEENFRNYGIRILLFARLTPGIRAPIFLTAGIVKLSLPRFLIADGIYAIPGVSLLFYLGFVFTERMVSLIREEVETAKSIIILVVVVGVAGYFAYRFLRRPMVTGDPQEMPPLAEEVAHTLDSVTHRMLEGKHKQEKEHPPGPADAVSQPEPAPEGGDGRPS